MSFTSPELDDRARPILAAAFAEPPDDHLLREAALLDDAPSSEVLVQHALWLGAARALADAGLTPEEIARIHVRAASPGVSPVSPRPQVVLPQLAPVFGRTLAREICDAVHASPDAPVPLRGAAQAALVRLAVDGALEARDEALVVPQLAGDALVRAIVRTLPADRREGFALARTPEKPTTKASAKSSLELLHAIRGLVDTPVLAARRAAYLEALATHHFYDDLVAAEQAGSVEEEPRPTAIAKASLERALEDVAKMRRIAQLGSHVAHAWSARAITVAAPELASVANWLEASDARRQEIAAEVARAVGPECSVAGIETFADPALPIAVLLIDGARFSLVPGGTVDVGLSDAEERIVREVAATHEEDDTYEEMYGSLFERVGCMRPVTRVSVGPLLAAQQHGDVVEPAALAETFATARYRAPSEAEWEYLARGGRAGEPTFRGRELPDSEAWFEATDGLRERGANAFGLWGFGFQPELCADAWSATHEGLPLDGSPRRGPGPRTTRGGAAQLYPWQETGEWQLLLTAMRLAHVAWEYALCVRPTIGIRLG